MHGKAAGSKWQPQNVGYNPCTRSQAKQAARKIVGKFVGENVANVGKTQKMIFLAPSCDPIRNVQCVILRFSD